MTLLMLAGLFLAALLLGASMHIALYPPTAALPPMWRNLARYGLGVIGFHLVLAIAIVVEPWMTAWLVLGLDLALATMLGLGVALGYLLLDD